jgi:hypothetical protein
LVQRSASVRRHAGQGPANHSAHQSSGQRDQVRSPTAGNH